MSQECAQLRRKSSSNNKQDRQEGDLQQGRQADNTVEAFAIFMHDPTYWTIVFFFLTGSRCCEDKNKDGLDARFS
jgi:hypothetical protein